MTNKYIDKDPGIFVDVRCNASHKAIYQGAEKAIGMELYAQNKRAGKGGGNG